MVFIQAWCVTDSTFSGGPYGAFAKNPCFGSINGTVELNLQTDSDIPIDALWRPANPMSLLTVLLLSGHELGLSSSWTLRDLDRTSAGFYIPSDYLHFSEPIMQDGTNFIRRVGYDFWTAKQFSHLFCPILERELKKQGGPKNREALTLIALASIIFPNRLPLCLEGQLT
jgi:hypothetical protein